MRTLRSGSMWYGHLMVCAGLLTCMVGVGTSEGVEKTGKPNEPATEEEVKRLLAEEQEVIDKIEMARFVISGKVVDETGRSLSGVTMNATWACATFFESKHEGWDRPKTIDGTFRVDIKKAESVTLNFEKEGYYAVKTNFYLPESMDQSDEVMDAEREGRKPNLKDLLIKLDNVRVVLEKKGVITTLTEFVGGLTYRPGSSGTVIDFDRPPQPDMEKQYVQKSTNLLDRKRLPPNCAYLVPELDNQDKPLMVELGVNHKGEKYYLPKVTAQVGIA